MVNKVSSYFPKVGFWATQTELKIIWTYHMLGETLSKICHKNQAAANHNKTTALENTTFY